MPRGKLRLPPHWSHVSTFLPTHQQNEVITLTLTGRSYLIKSQPPEHILVFKAENGIWSLSKVSPENISVLSFSTFPIHQLIVQCLSQTTDLFPEDGFSPESHRDTSSPPPRPSLRLPRRRLPNGWVLSLAQSTYHGLWQIRWKSVVWI